MASFEENLAYANKILRIRDAMISGNLFKDSAFSCIQMGADSGNYEITFDHNGGVGIATIAYLENRVGVEIVSSYAGHARIYYNNENDRYHVMGDDTDYQYLPTAPDESWYFQASLIYNDEILRGAIIMKTLAATPMPGFKQFIVMPMLLDKILTRMDQEGI